MPLIDDTHTYISYPRGIHGESLLHLMIIDGNVSKILELIDKNACINAFDSRHNDVLYYACSHPGTDNILKNNIELRNTIVKILLDNGANPHQRGGFSGKRAYEIAIQHEYQSTVNLIVNHDFYDLFKILQTHFNERTSPLAINVILKQFVCLKWMLDSIHWLFIPNRENIINMIIHPKIKQQVDTYSLNNTHLQDTEQSKILIENMFIDYQLKYKKMIIKFKKLLINMLKILQMINK